MQGGAYGAFNVLDRMNGTMSFASYRDPNVAKTIDIFDKSGQYLRSIISDRGLLEKGVIGVVGDMDAHLLPDAKGFTSMLRWLGKDTEDIRQGMREQVLRLDPGHFEVLAQACEQAARNGIVSVLGARSALDQYAVEGWSLERLL